MLLSVNHSKIQDIQFCSITSKSGGRARRPRRADLMGIETPAMDNRGSRRMMSSGAFFEVSFKAGIVTSKWDYGNP